jgi:hypothetical protein
MEQPIPADIPPSEQRDGEFGLQALFLDTDLVIGESDARQR